MARHFLVIHPEYGFSDPYPIIESVMTKQVRSFVLKIFAFNAVLVACVFSSSFAGEQTALDEYVVKPDASFTFELLKITPRLVGRRTCSK